jgi:hypothetical protein
MHRATSRAEQAQLRERLIATAWNERGSEMARLVAETLGHDGHYDPRVALLRVDLYEKPRRDADVCPSRIPLI